MVGYIASFSVCTKIRGVMEHPRGVYGTPIEIKIKHPSEALFVIVLKTPTKELPKLPIFNSVTHAKTLYRKLPSNRRVLS